MVFLIIKLSDCVIQEAAVREVREETGLELKATSLLVVENPSPAWFRFTFTGKIIGTITYNHSELCCSIYLIKVIMILKHVLMIMWLVLIRSRSY